MEINKVQWRMIAKGEKLPCDSFLMKKDGTMTSMVTGAGVTVGQDAYYLPVEELMSFPKEESEDERIRKELIAEVKEQIDCIPVPDCRDKEDEKALKQLNKWLAWLEKQAEKKPDDKVEPKFKVGDWFIKNVGSHINKDYDTCKISKVGNVYYTIESIYGYTGKIAFETFDENYHLWTIQDAKDGDVLADDNLPFIFKKVDSMMHSYAYCGISVDDGFKIESEGESGEWTWMQDIKPATKEQRDTLLKAMTDAGYTFDFEKKELKKIELRPYQWNISDFRTWQYIVSDVLTKHDGIGQYLDDGLCKKIAQDMQEEWSKKLCPVQHPTEWSKEDEAHIDSLLKRLGGISKPGAAFISTRFAISEDEDWLKSLRQQSQQEWSEEDEKEVAVLEAYIRSKDWSERHIDRALGIVYELVKKLESLRPQSHWKPSDEQMNALRYVTNFDYGGYKATLVSLYQDLKKLRE